MFCRHAHSVYATKRPARACHRIAGNLTRCIDACDFARATLEIRSGKRLTTACKAGERASAGDHNIDVGAAIS